MPRQEKEKPESGVRELIHKKFLEERKVFLWGEVNDRSSMEVIERLAYLEMMDPTAPVHLYMNTPGGSTTSGMAVYDMIRVMQAPVEIIVMGMAASMGSIILCAAKKKNRLIYPHGKVLIHQPLIMGRIEASAIDIHIQAEETEKIREEGNKIIAHASGQPLEKVEKDSDRDYYMNAHEAIEYGIVDRIVNEF